MKNTYQPGKADHSTGDRPNDIIVALHGANRYLLLLVSVTLCFLFASVSEQLQAQLPFEESFRNSTAEGFFFGGSPNPAILTASSIDPEGEGVLRLTTNVDNQTGFVYSSGIALPSAGLHIEFEYFTYGGDGADGIAFFLFDASADPFQIGGFGGSLGYAQRSPDLPGVSKAYLGIGLDEYGNFSNPSEHRQGGPGRLSQTVTLRGAGNGNADTSDNYPYLTHVQVSQPPFDFDIEGGGSTRATDPASERYRKAIIRLKPRTEGGFFVDMDIITGGNPQTVHHIIVDYVYPVTPPDVFKVGFSSSTGGNNNYHE
ncbi:MAG: lectin-like domain-containing protein, partial [Bacteroidota bacterium]